MYLGKILLAPLIALLATGASAQTVPADLPPTFVPLGAYLSWERTVACAKYYDIDQWQDVTTRLDALQANHVNLLWVTNMSEADLPRLIVECEKRNMRLLPSMGAVEAKIDWRWVDDGSYYDTVLPRIVKAAGDSKTLVGWVLSDEPLVEHFPRLETLRRKFRELDPKRFCTAVTMWPQTPQVPVKTKLPLICIDLYPFFGPDDPNGPHTDAASKGYFRRNALKMMDAIGDGPAVGWVMGMCFSDIWGPRKYDAQGHLIGLPGSYLHWRCPTLAEMRWQVWETFRVGAKGFVCYTLAPEAPNAENATLPPADVAWKEVLATKETDLGPNALTNPDGSVTPQLEELGRVYAQLAPHADLILRLERSEEALVEVDAPAQVQTFIDPETKTLYAIVVNDDLHESRGATLRVGESVSTVIDLIRNHDVPLTKNAQDGSATGTMTLAAGDGTLLKISYR